MGFAPLLGIGETVLLTGSRFSKKGRESQRTQANDLFKIAAAFSEGHR